LGEGRDITHEERIEGEEALDYSTALHVLAQREEREKKGGEREENTANHPSARTVARTRHTNLKQLSDAETHDQKVCQGEVLAEGVPDPVNDTGMGGLALARSGLRALRRGVEDEN